MERMPDVPNAANIVTGPSWISPYPRPVDARPVLERRPKTAGGPMRPMRFAATASYTDAAPLMSNLRKCIVDCGLPDSLLQRDPYGVRPIIADFTDWEMAPQSAAAQVDIAAINGLLQSGRRD